MNDIKQKLELLELFQEMPAWNELSRKEKAHIEQTTLEFSIEEFSELFSKAQEV